MDKLTNYKRIRAKIVLLFILTLLFSPVFIHKVVADEIKDGSLEITSGDWINIKLGTNVTILWQFEVDTNERAIYWEIIGYEVFETGWGPNANCTTPILNETNTRYEYICHGYYAKYHVWSTMIVTCTKTGQNDGGGDDSIDPTIFLYIGFTIVSLSVIALAVVIYLRRKKKQAFF